MHSQDAPADMYSKRQKAGVPGAVDQRMALLQLTSSDVAMDSARIMVTVSVQQSCHRDSAWSRSVVALLCRILFCLWATIYERCVHEDGCHTICALRRKVPRHHVVGEAGADECTWGHTGLAAEHTGSSTTDRGS